MVGKKIKQYLTDNGIKQKFLAQKAGLSDAVISAICQGERKIDVIEYHKICKALNVSMDLFVEDDEEE